jgi:hypothetical protein
MSRQNDPRVHNYAPFTRTTRQLATPGTRGMTPGRHGSSGNGTVGDRVPTLDEAFHVLMAEMPEGWRFKALYLASHEGRQERGRRRPGHWYAHAVGPDPKRPEFSYGLTGEGRPGVLGVSEAVLSLAKQLAVHREREILKGGS